MENHNYGKLNPDNAIAYAPATLADERGVIANPNEAQYRARGWLPIVSEPPTRFGVEFVPTKYGDIVDGRIVRRYDERPIVAPEPPVTRYSKLKLIVAAKAVGKWSALKAFIASAGYEDEWSACQFLASNYPQFAAAKEAIVAAGIATAEEVETILAASVDKEVR